jgi:predicted nuclease of predicted toxin-antitoxin system
MNGYYFDEHMSRKVARGLIERGVMVVLAADVGMEDKDDDSEHLPFATSQALVMVTFDRPFAGRTMQRTDFLGLVCLNKSIMTDIGRQVEVLVEFAQLFDPEKDTAHVIWLP